MNINEKAAYLKGCFDFADLNKDSKEIKIMEEMLDLISKMAKKISELEADNAELRDYIEEIDEDLGAVEEDLYMTDGEDDDYDDLNDDEDYDEDEEGFRYNAVIDYKMDCDQWLSEIKENQLYDTGIEVEFGDEFVTLTTCDRSRHRNGRFVVVCRKIREGETFE